MDFLSLHLGPFAGFSGKEPMGSMEACSGHQNVQWTPLSGQSVSMVLGFKVRRINSINGSYDGLSLMGFPLHTDLRRILKIRNAFEIVFSKLSRIL